MQNKFEKVYQSIIKEATIPEYDWERQKDGLIVRNLDTGKTMFVQGEQASELEDELEKALEHKSPEWAVATVLEEYENAGLFESRKRNMESPRRNVSSKLNENK